jgi:hypothetical protein
MASSSARTDSMKRLAAGSTAGTRTWCEQRPRRCCVCRQAGVCMRRERARSARQQHRPLQGNAATAGRTQRTPRRQAKRGKPQTQPQTSKQAHNALCSCGSCVCPQTAAAGRSAAPAARRQTQSAAGWQTRRACARGGACEQHGAQRDAGRHTTATRGNTARLQGNTHLAHTRPQNASPASPPSP